MQLFGDQEKVFMELRTKIQPLIERSLSSNGYLVFDNGGESNFGGGEVDIICHAVAADLGLPFIRIPCHSRSADILEDVKSQILEDIEWSDGRRLESELYGIVNTGAIVSTGMLINRYVKVKKKPCIVYLGPLEAYSQLDYAIQDLIQFFLDSTPSLFFIISASKNNWRDFPRQKCGWQKVCDRMRYMALESEINPVSDVKEYIRLLQFLYDSGMIRADTRERAIGLWNSIEDRTLFGIKMQLGSMR